MRECNDNNVSKRVSVRSGGAGHAHSGVTTASSLASKRLSIAVKRPKPAKARQGKTKT
jgi:hypothetical protein